MLGLDFCFLTVNRAHLLLIFSVETEQVKPDLMASP